MAQTKLATNNRSASKHWMDVNETRFMESSYWSNSYRLPAFPTLASDVTVDVAVIGAGVTGITAAALLKKCGATVALIERGRCAAVDTASTTAHLTYVADARLHELAKHFGKDAAKHFWQAGAAAIDTIHALAGDDLDACEFQWVPGYLHAPLAGTNEKDCDSLKEDAALALELGFSCEFIDDAPFANRCGVRFPNQAKFHPLKYLAQLVKEIPGDGSHAFENTEVHEVTGKHSLSVKAGKQKIHCKFLVIATHTPLLGKTGLLKGGLFQSKLALYTSYVLGAKIPKDLVPEALYWDTSDPYFYLRVDKHRQGEYAIFGGGDTKTGQEENPAANFRQLEAKLRLFLPEAEIEHRWLGQVVETNDGLPFIGENEEGQFIATGFAGNGITLGTVAAMMACDHFLQRENPWRDLFAVDRKKFHGGTWRYLKENADYPYFMLRHRLRAAEHKSPSDLKRGEGAIILHEKKKIAAYRDAHGKLNLLSPVCTHLGCIVRWNAADKTWDCPCHGSRFEGDGKVHSGPAETPLKKI